MVWTRERNQIVTLEVDGYDFQFWNSKQMDIEVSDQSQIHIMNYEIRKYKPLRLMMIDDEIVVPY